MQKFSWVRDETMITITHYSSLIGSLIMYPIYHKTMQILLGKARITGIPLAVIAFEITRI